MKLRTSLSRILPMVVLAPILAAPLSAQSTDQSVGDRVAVEGGAYWTISVAELQGMLDAERKPLLVNTHVPYQGDIQGTDVSIVFNQVADHLDQLPADKNAPVVLYCRTGPMSNRAATTLAGLGYTRVYSLEGGFEAWATAGLPMAER